MEFVTKINTTLNRYIHAFKCLIEIDSWLASQIPDVVVVDVVVSVVDVVIKSGLIGHIKMPITTGVSDPV